MERFGGKEAEFRVAQKNYISRAIGHQIDRDNRKHNQPQLGIKRIVLNMYTEKGEQAAWEELQKFNEKLSGNGYTLEMLKQWIGEYNNKQQNRGMKKDDGCDR